MSDSPILVWNDTAQRFIRGVQDDDPARDRSWRGTGQAARLCAMLQVAMHDSLAGLKTLPRLQPRWAPPVDVPGISPTLGVFAAMGAGACVLEDAFTAPERREVIATTAKHLWDAQPAHDDPDAARAFAYGQAVATALLADPRRAEPELDPEDDPHLPQDPETFGNFGFNRAPAAYRNLTPFVMDRIDRFHAAPPPVRTSIQYARDWHEVYATGRAATRAATPESYESRMAWMFAGGVGTSQESGYWMEIAQMVVQAEALPTVSEESLAMTAVAVAICDAMISSWNSKWTYTSFRPLVAIRHADQDGNPHTFPDPDWTPYNGGQGGSPEHTSGTATFAGACSTVLAHLYGDTTTFEIDFQRDRDDRPIGSETFHSFGLAADIATNSRIWNGIHFRFAGEAGLAAGRTIGRLVIQELEL